jgi:NADH dehydrogenase/NADH:ubiquinone oxidoreductase subunit G
MRKTSKPCGAHSPFWEASSHSVKNDMPELMELEGSLCIHCYTF